MSRHLRFLHGFTCCFLTAILICSGKSWAQGADSVYSSVELFYHTDYTPDGEPYRDRVFKETNMPADMLDETKSGDLQVGSYTSEAYSGSAPGYNHVASRVHVTDAKQERVWAQSYSYWSDQGIVSTLSADTEGVLCLDITLHGTSGGDGNSFFFEVDCEGDCWQDSGNLYFSTRGNLNDVPVSLSGCFGYVVGGDVHLYAEMEVSSIIGDYDGSGEWDGVLYSGESYATFSDTAAVTGFTITDGHSITWSSGTVYPVAYTAPGSSGSSDSSGGGGGGGGGCFLSALALP